MTLFLQIQINLSNDMINKDEKDGSGAVQSSKYRDFSFL